MSRGALALGLLLAGCAGARPAPEALAACQGAAVDPAVLRGLTEALTTRFAPRDLDHPANVDRAAAFISDELRARGLQPHDQPFQVQGRTYRNVVASNMGSAVHARALAAAKVQVRLMISLEMIGAFSDEEGSQDYPAVIGWFYPSRGNFIAVVGKWGQGGHVRGVARAMRAGSALPVETLVAPRSVTGVDWSDHQGYWDAGYPAVMVTDTSFFRNDRYHTPRDTADTLDHPRMAEVVKGVACAVQSVARR